MLILTQHSSKKKESKKINRIIAKIVCIKYCVIIFKPFLWNNIKYADPSQNR
jgi:hypothetical protein